jgi:hypothetical protein
MTGDLSWLTTELDALTRNAAEPSGVDLERVVHAGWRLRQRRRVLRISAVVALLAASAAVAGLAVANQSRPTPTGVTTGAPTGTATTPSQTPFVARHYTGTDPVTAQGAFGWLPASVAGVTYDNGPAYGTDIEAKGSGTEGAHIILTVYPPGQTPQLGTFVDTKEPEHAVAAAPINGHTAYWVTSNPSDPTNGGMIHLRWQAANGQWAEVYAYYLVAADLEGTIRHIASTATVGNAAVPLPPHIAGLPTDFVVSQASLNQPDPSGQAAWSVVLGYSVDGAYVTIEITPGGGSARTSPSACKTQNGLTACVMVDNSTPPALIAIGGAPGLLSRITLLGTDQRNWTTGVVG